MDHQTKESEARFETYVEGLCEVIGHADRNVQLHDYCTGLLMPIKRKSVEPIAAVTAPARTSAKHQSLLHFVGQSPWSDDKVLAKVREMVLPELTRDGPVKVSIIDDTGFPKKGRHSVGVTRQYCGQTGKRDNCQIAVSLSLANDAGSLPIAWRLYLPKEWVDDDERRKEGKVPDDISFKTKPEIALEQITKAHKEGIELGVVLADAAYGNNTDFRSGLTALGLQYVVGINGTTSVWPPECAPLPPKPSQTGKPATRLQRDDDHQPVSAKHLAMELDRNVWREVTWREGTNAPLSSRFAALRVRPAHRDYWLTTPRDVEWLLIEWPENEDEPSKFWLSTLPAETALEELVGYAKMRWRIERDYQDLKQEIGLGDYEGRSWRGFHHHATLAIAAYGFLICEKQNFPPSGAEWAG